MKVDEFLQNRDPGDETKEDDFQHVTSLTPSGIEVLYSWEPKRLYRICHGRTGPPVVIDIPEGAKEWREVPSVTSVLGVLDKPALPWWGMKVGIEGVTELFYRDALNVNMLGGLERKVDEREYVNVDTDDIVALLTHHKLTVNHVKDKAADRGTNVHGALESWAIDQDYRANPGLYEEHERGYIVGLNKFLDDLGEHGRGEVFDVEAEVMVGSLENGFAGRYDLRLIIPSSREMVVKTYPKRTDKRETVDAGSYLLDLKTSKSVYATHAAQLAAYELASIECGYGATNYRAVIHVTSEGKYEFVRTHARPEDFLSILQAYNTMSRAKSWLQRG